MTARLHYIYDPLCGWCYGAEPLASAAAASPALEFVMHGGGLWPEPTRLPEETRRYIQQADARIALLSGQPFGAAYLSGLLLDATMTLDSRPTIAAVLAAESLDSAAGMAMLRAIQHGHYVEGRRVVEAPVLADIAASVGLDRAAFESSRTSFDVDGHIAATRALMHEVDAKGFPTFVLEVDGRLDSVQHNHFAGNAAGFVAHLERRAA